MVLTVFERDRTIITGAVKTPDIYADWLNVAADQATRDLTEVRREFRKRGIKVFEIERSEKFVTARYMCRGYTGEMSMLWTLIAAEAGLLMRKYLGVVSVE